MEKKTEKNTEEETEKKAEKRVKVKKWNAIAEWRYDVENDACSICHNNFVLPCISCEAEPYKSDEKCELCWGACGHSFHFHCITRWLKTNSTCPLDNSEWDFVKFTETG